MTFVVSCYNLGDTKLKKEPLEKALSLFGRKPDFLEEDNAALRYAFMIGQAPVTENGEFMLELGRAGLAQEFLKSIKKFCDDIPQATSFKHRIHEAAFAFADEYVKLMQEQDEKILMGDFYFLHLPFA